MAKEISLAGKQPCPPTSFTYKQPISSETTVPCSFSKKKNVAGDGSTRPAGYSPDTVWSK